MDTMAEDLLKGAKEIGDFIGETERRAFHLCETGVLPVFKLGRLYRARKSTLRAWIEQREAAAGEKAA